MPTIGPTFGKELEDAGLLGLPFAWSPEGAFTGREALTAEQDAALQTVIDAHDPMREARRLVPKSLILSRLTDKQLDAALAAMTTRQKERWRAPDHPAIYSDDPEAVGLIQTIGADPSEVLSSPTPTRPLVKS